MVNICGSNLVPILITILCSAGLFMYFNLRLSEIKVSVEKQNRVLTAFITNVQQDIRTGGECMRPLNSTNLAAPEALVAARKFVSEDGKIVVSDDEDSEDDDDDDVDSDSDSESSSDSEDDVEYSENVDTIKTIKIVNLPEQLTQQLIIPISFEVLPFESGSEGHSSAIASASESSITEIIDELSSDAPSSDAPSSDAHSSSDAPSTEQMKVDDLRKLITDKNLATKEEAKKLKKPELLLLLKK